MRGDFISVWSETWQQIWHPLAESKAAPPDVFCELYRELVTAFAEPPGIETLVDIIDDPKQSWEAFEASGVAEFSGEKALVRFFEVAFQVLEDLQGDELANLYFGLLSTFIEKYNLGYSLRRPCALSPTLAGMFADLAVAIKRLASTDEHLSALHRAHEEALRDLRYGATEERIKTCIGRQVMLLEAFAASVDSVTANTLGSMCDQVATWPHATIKESLKKLYGFASDYPGIRHAGNPASKIRSIEIHDLAALSILLIGFSPYLTHGLNTNLAKLWTVEQ